MTFVPIPHIVDDQLIATQWGNAVADAVNKATPNATVTYATVAAMNAVAAPDGSTAYVTANKTFYQRISNGWRATTIMTQNPYTGAGGGTFVPTPSSLGPIVIVEPGSYLIGISLDIQTPASGWGFCTTFPADAAGNTVGQQLMRGIAFETSAVGYNRNIVNGLWACDVPTANMNVYARTNTYSGSVTNNGYFIGAARIGPLRSALL